MIQYRNDDSRTKHTVPISPCDIYPETFPASPTSWILCRVPKCCFEYSFMHRLFDAARLHSEHRNSHLRKMIAYFSPALSTCCADGGEGGEISCLVVLEIKYRAQWDASGSLGALFISGRSQVCCVCSCLKSWYILSVDQQVSLSFTQSCETSEDRWEHFVLILDFFLLVGLNRNGL